MANTPDEISVTSTPKYQDIITFPTSLPCSPILSVKGALPPWIFSFPAPAYQKHNLIHPMLPGFALCFSTDNVGFI